MTNKNMDLNTTELLEALIALSRKAGEDILNVYETNFDVQSKADQSPLTAADMASHKTICDGLAQLTPDTPVLSEESANIPYSMRKLWHQYWLVDPLDGTREFIKRNGEFTVNIALIDNHEPTMGVVYTPVTGMCYYANRGHGAFKQAKNQSPEPIRTKRTETGHFVVAGSRSHGTDQQQQFVSSLGSNVEMMAIGSSLKLCLVAEGKVDIYPRFGSTSEWDTAAAHCVAQEAGAIVTDIDFAPLRYNMKESLLNPFFLVIADPGFDWKPYLKDNS